MTWTPTEATRARVNNEPPEQVDVAIVGAGLGGLTAAGFLARLGHSVAVFDSHYVAGGCATMFGRKREGSLYAFDIGLHYVGDCGPAGRVPSLLRALEADVEWLPMDQDGFDTLVFPDFEFRIPADPELYRSRLLELFPAEKKGIDRYMKLLHQLRGYLRRVEASGEAARPGFGDAVDVVLRRRMMARYATKSVAEFLDSCTIDPKLRAVLLGQNGDYGLPPSEVACLLHAGLANHYFQGAYYPRGGGQMLADNLCASIEAAGGTICLTRGIEKILVENGRAVGVRTEPRKGEQHDVSAKIVLSNADIIATYKDLLDPEHLSAKDRQKVDGWQMAGAIFLTCLGVTADMREKGMRATNYWQFDGYDMEGFYLEARERQEPVPRGCYVTSATLKDPATTHHAPAGVTNIEVMTVVPGNAAAWGLTHQEALTGNYRRQQAYQSKKGLVEQDLVNRLESLFPGTKDTIVFQESASPVTQTRYTRASGGSGYGLAASPDQFLNARPGYRGPVAGMYLCGASTRAGHGIVGAMSSGWSAAKRVARELGTEVPGI